MRTTPLLQVGSWEEEMLKTTSQFSAACITLDVGLKEELDTHFEERTTFLNHTIATVHSSNRRVVSSVHQHDYRVPEECVVGYLEVDNHADTT